MSRVVEMTIVRGDIYVCEIVLASGRSTEHQVSAILKEKSLLEQKLKLLEQMDIIEESLAAVRKMDSLPNDGWDL